MIGHRIKYSDPLIIEGGWRPSIGVTHPDGRALDVSHIGFDPKIPLATGDNVIMKVFKDGDTDISTKDVTGSYDARVKEFSRKLSEQSGVNQVISPWEEYRFNQTKGSFGWVDNTAESKLHDNHRNHLHFSMR